MMLKLDGAARAERIAQMVPVMARRRADAVATDDWSDVQSRADYVTMLRSMEAWTTGPEWDRVVEVRPRLRPDGDYWTGTAAAVLDQAADRVDTALGESYTFEHGRIEDIPGSHGARLVCERKPNLERAFHPLWHGHDPMIAVDLDGRTYYLNWDQQNMARTVANRELFRHGHGAGMHAKFLLLLAKSLRVDTYTATRLTYLVVPNRCGVYLEENTALRILSAEEERGVLVARGAHYTALFVRDEVRA